MRVSSFQSYTNKYWLEVEFENENTNRAGVVIHAMTINEPNLMSVVCSLNELVGLAPDYIIVDGMGNAWFIPTDKISSFINWFQEIPEEQMNKMLDQDRIQGEWS